MSTTTEPRRVDAPVSDEKPNEESREAIRETKEFFARLAWEREHGIPDTRTYYTDGHSLLEAVRKL